MTSSSSPCIYSGIQFFDRKEIKDALSYLRMIAYRDDLSFQRIANVPKRNLGQRRMAFLQEYAEQNKCSLYEALKANLDNALLKGTKAHAFVDLNTRYEQMDKAGKRREASRFGSRGQSQAPHHGGRRNPRPQHRQGRISHQV